MSNTVVTLLLWVIVPFLPKNADISKIKRALILKGIFSETTNVCVLTFQIPKFQVSGIIPSMIPVSFRKVKMNP